MLGIGLSELLMIAVVMLIVLRPAQIPDAVYKLGKGLAKIRQYYQICHYQYQKALDTIDDNETPKDKQTHSPSD